MGAKLRALQNQSIKRGTVKEMDIESDKENELDEDWKEVWKLKDRLFVTIKDLTFIILIYA